MYTEGNNIHNTGSLSFTAGLTPKLDLQATYVNNLYAYQQTFGDVPPKTSAAQPFRRLGSHGTTGHRQSQLEGHE